MGHEFISKNEVESAILALEDWIGESGILRVIGKMDYAFVLIGSTTYGYAIKNKSDVDLVLLYERYEKRHTLEEYERMHAELSKFSSEAEKQKVRNIERIEKEIKEKLERTVSPLLREEEIIKNSKFTAELCTQLGMKELSLDLFTSWLKPHTADRYPQAYRNLEDKLSAIDLHFGDLLAYPIPHLKDLLLGDWEFHGRGAKALAEALFALKRGRVIAARDKNTPKKFEKFIISVIKVYVGCELAKRFFEKKEAEIYIKTARRSEDPAMQEYANVLEEELKKFVLWH